MICVDRFALSCCAESCSSASSHGKLPLRLILAASSLEPVQDLVSIVLVVDCVVFVRFDCCWCCVPLALQIAEKEAELATCRGLLEVANSKIAKARSAQERKLNRLLERKQRVQSE